MTVFARWRSWLRAVARGRRLDSAIREELEFHIDACARDLRRKGMDPREAERRARAEFGGVGARMEECRDALGLRVFDEFRGDVRYALRLLRRSPVFTVVAILSLGLGIGANTAIFSLVDSLLLKSIPVAGVDRLFFVDDSGGKSEGGNGPPYPCYEILRDRTRGFAGVAMFAEDRFRITTRDGVEERVRGQYASGNYFDVLGVRANRGRLLVAADDPAGGNGGPDGPVVVISHAYWKRRFNMDPAAVGARVRVGEREATIVGVTPPEFFGLTVGAPVDITVPVTFSNANLATKNSWWFTVVARLADGASREAARAEADAIFQAYVGEMGLKGEARRYFNRIELVPAAKGLNHVRRQFSTPLTIVMLLVALVLAIACANVANLLLARGSARRDEIALRQAIGAGRGRLVRQLVTEGLVLSAIGALLGVLLAGWSVALIVRMVAATREQISLSPSLDTRVLAFTAGVAIVTGVLCSLVPAMRTTRSATAGEGRASQSPSRRRSGSALVFAQITLSLLLLCGAMLFVRTLKSLQRVDPGFRPDGVVVLPLEAAMPRLPPAADPRAELAKIARAWEALAAGAGRVPGAQSAAVTTLSPMSGRDRQVVISIVGEPPIPEPDNTVHLNLVTAGIFETLGLPVLAGRAFGAVDQAASVKTAIISEATARRYFGSASPLGRSVTINTKADRYEIVGVVRDARYENLRTPGDRMVYLLYSQAAVLLGKGAFTALLAVRGQGDAAAMAAPLREEVRQIVPGGRAGAAMTVADQVRSSLLQERLLSMFATTFGGLALLLAGIGVYGVQSYAVAGRTREFGIRMAIGASRYSVTWLVVREAFGLVALALVVGLLIVRFTGRYVESTLFGITASDPLSVGSAMAILVVTAMAAAWVPAWRAGRISPTAALRHE